MAEIWGAALVAGATVAGSAYAANRAGAAADAQAGAAGSATAESARQYDTTRADLAPYRVTGTGALNQLASLFGLPSTTAEEWQGEQDQLVGDTMLPAGVTFRFVDDGWYDVNYEGKRIGYLRPGGPNGQFINDTNTDIEGLKRQRQQQATTDRTPSGPDMSAFFESPGYQFRRDEGMRGIERSAAARGGAFSGNALRALTDFNSNLASSEFGNYFNQLAGIAGIGQTSTNQTAAYGAQHAANASQNALAAGDARASGIVNQANIIGSGINQLGGIAGYFGRKPTVPGYAGGQYPIDPYGNYGGGGIGYA